MRARITHQTILLVVIAGIAFLMCLVCTPHFIRSGPSKITGIISNLRQIDAAKQQWASEHEQRGNALPTKEDIAPYFLPHLNGWVKPVAGELYRIKSLCESPEAQLTHALEGKPKDTLFRLGTNDDEIILPPIP